MQSNVFFQQIMVQELISTTTDKRALVASHVSNIDDETANKGSTGYNGICTDMTSWEDSRSCRSKVRELLYSSDLGAKSSECRTMRKILGFFYLFTLEESPHFFFSF